MPIAALVFDGAICRHYADVPGIRTTATDRARGKGFQGLALEAQPQRQLQIRENARLVSVNPVEVAGVLRISRFRGASAVRHNPVTGQSHIKVITAETDRVDLTPPQRTHPRPQSTPMTPLARLSPSTQFCSCLSPYPLFFVLGISRKFIISNSKFRVWPKPFLTSWKLLQHRYFFSAQDTYAYSKPSSMPDNDIPSLPNGGEGAAVPNDGSDVRNRQKCCVVTAGGSANQKGHDHCDAKPGKNYEMDFSAVFAEVMEETKNLDKETLEERYPWMSEFLGPEIPLLDDG